jgi:kynurenine formamidase
VSVLIDLSVATQHTASEATPVIIDLLDHRTGATVLGLTPEDFPDGMAISNYGPTSGGAPAKSIDRVPLEWCMGRGVRLDVRHVPAGAGITVDHLLAAIDAARCELRPGDIVMLWTGADKLWGSAEYLTTFPGLTGKGTAFLVEQGIRVIGIDAWGLDRPAATMVEEYKRTRDKGVLWPSHIYGRTNEYLQLEKLANLERLPRATDFTICCFPVSIAGAGAGWTRVVAIVDD